MEMMPETMEQPEPQDMRITPRLASTSSENSTQ